MKLNFHQRIILLILVIIPTSYTYQECSSFKPNFEADCSSLSDKTKTCRYYNKQCKCKKIQCSDLDTKEKCENYYVKHDYDRFCAYDNEKGCFEQKKYCSEWSFLYGRDLCSSNFEATKSNIHVCRYNDGQCIDNPGNCRLMTYSDETDPRLKCETIIPTYEYHKCLFDPNGKEGENCIQVEICSTATTQEECESMILPERSRRYKCVFKDGQCLTEKKYVDNCGLLKKDVSKEECEANIPYSDIGKCIYDNTRGCITEKKPCSEWKKYFNHERDYGFCVSIFGSTKPGYECRFINGECVEHLGDCINSFQYTDMSKEACESIIPLNYEYDKCSFNLFNGKKECNFKRKLCTEDIPKYALYICYTRQTENSEMVCISDGEKCIESYGKCEDYKTDVNQQKCESIKPYNDLGIFSCIYKNNLCKSISWYEMELQKFKSQCENIQYSKNENCSFVNDECIQQKKNCLDIKSINDDLTDEICKEGILSDPNKVCVLNNDKKGCEEKIISVKTTTVTNGDENEENKKSDENKGEVDDDNKREEDDENKGKGDDKNKGEGTDKNEEDKKSGENEGEGDDKNEGNEGTKAEIYKINFYIFVIFILFL